MNAPDSIPPEIAHTVDLDGVHLELAARTPWLEFLFPRRFSNWLLTTALVVPGALGLAGHGDAALTIHLALLFAWVVIIGQNDRTVTHHLLLGPHGLVATIGDRRTEIPWRELGTVGIVGDLLPVLQVRRVGSGVFSIPMQNEPGDHARWLARSLQGRGRQAREQGGSSHDIPQSLRQTRSRQTTGY